MLLFFQVTWNHCDALIQKHFQILSFARKQQKTVEIHMFLAECDVCSRVCIFNAA